MNYKPEHLAAALTWIEQNIEGGLQIVAGALAETAPQQEPTKPPPEPRPHKTVCASLVGGLCTCTYVPETGGLDLSGFAGKRPAALQGEGATGLPQSREACESWCGKLWSEAIDHIGKHYVCVSADGYCYDTEACCNAGRSLAPPQHPTPCKTAPEICEICDVCGEVEPCEHTPPSPDTREAP